MNWILLTLACILCWSTTDLFYKKGSDISDKYSHLKFLVWLGIVMGASTFLLLPLSERQLPLGELFMEYVEYAPFAAAYVLALMCGIIGRRFLDVSVASPLENIDGAFAAVILLIYFVATGAITDLSEHFTLLDPIGFILIVFGVVYLGIQEQKISKAEAASNAEKKKHPLGALAFIFPFVYTLFDAVSMVFEGVILNDDGGETMGEIDFIILEGVMFLIMGAGAWLYLLLAKKTIYNPFGKGEMVKCAAALTENAGNIVFTFAIAKNPILTPPVTTSYFIFTMIGARIFLKEKMSKKQYICLFILSIGIILLGISEIVKNS
ncbi:MAG: hypothetical protein ACI4K7_02305 [Oscillospiraceae bacterium]